MKMSHTNLRKVLLDSLINPQKPGPVKVILEANNPTYFLQRVQEILREVQNPESNSSQLKRLRDEKLKMAVLLIAAARLLEADNATQERPKSKGRKQQHSDSSPRGVQTESGSGNSTVHGGTEQEEKAQDDSGQEMRDIRLDPIPPKGKHG